MKATVTCHLVSSEAEAEKGAIDDAVPCQLSRKNRGGWGPCVSTLFLASFWWRRSLCGHRNNSNRNGKRPNTTTPTIAVEFSRLEHGRFAGELTAAWHWHAASAHDPSNPISSCEIALRRVSRRERMMIAGGRSSRAPTLRWSTCPVRGRQRRVSRHAPPARSPSARARGRPETTGEGRRARAAARQRGALQTCSAVRRTPRRGHWLVLVGFYLLAVLIRGRGVLAVRSRIVSARIGHPDWFLACWKNLSRQSASRVGRITNLRCTEKEGKNAGDRN
jgi:hypothetical protein